jgi:hypothetical protein
MTGDSRLVDRWRMGVGSGTPQTDIVGGKDQLCEHLVFHHVYLVAYLRQLTP